MSFLIFYEFYVDFLEKPAIRRGLDDFGFNSRLLSRQTLEPELNSNLLFGCLDLGRILEIDLLSGAYGAPSNSCRFWHGTSAATSLATTTLSAVLPHPAWPVFVSRPMPCGIL